MSALTPEELAVRAKRAATGLPAEMTAEWWQQIRTVMYLAGHGAYWDVIDAAFMRQRADSAALSARVVTLQEALDDATTWLAACIGRIRDLDGEDWPSFVPGSPSNFAQAVAACKRAALAAGRVAPPEPSKQEEGATAPQSQVSKGIYEPYSGWPS